MKFAKVIGYSTNPETKKIILEAQERLSSIFTELSLGFDNKSIGTGIGGDPLVFQLVWPLNHYVDITSIQLKEFDKKQKEIEEKLKNGEPLSEDEEPFDENTKSFRKKMGRRVLHTAATDGKSYYWCPQFVVKLSKIGLRLVVFHESFHSLYMHVGRRGSRMPQLWNISVDYRVNFSAMEDLRARDIKDYASVFTKELGEYILLEEYASFLRDPFNPPPRLAHLNPMEGLRKMADPAYQDPFGDVPPMYYADPALSDDMKRPENVYDYLLAQIPKCPKCGKLGKYKKPEEYKALQKKIREQEEKKAEEQKKAEEEKKKLPQADPDCCKDGKESDKGCCDHDHGQSSTPGQGQSKPGQGQPTPGQGEESCCGDGDKSCGCPECGGDDSEYIDPFGAGETLDDHIDSDVSEEELGKRISDAMEIAKRMGGKIPGSLEDELSSLISPKLTWEDFVRQQMTKKRNGYGKADWLRPKSRPMFAGLYIPKKRDHFLRIGAFIDSSGSMSRDDMSFIVSQLQVIDERGEIDIAFWDTQVYWDNMVKIKKADKESLLQVKPIGRGGTMASDIFNQYEEHCGALDLIIVGTDGYLYDTELNNAKQPPRETQVLWLISSHNPNFKPPFGRVMHLLNE